MPQSLYGTDPAGNVVPLRVDESGALVESLSAKMARETDKPANTDRALWAWRLVVVLLLGADIAAHFLT